MTALNKQALRSKARSASAGEWIKESGDGWEAICSADDQANGNFIIAHFEGPDAQANREFVQAANPDTVLALLDELEAKDRLNAELIEKQRLIDICQGQGLEHRIAAEKRAEAAEKRIAELETRAISIPEVRITVAESKRKNLTWRELGAYNEGADVAKEAILAVILAAGIGVKGE